jgi:hypothetical protein
MKTKIFLLLLCAALFTTCKKEDTLDSDFAGMVSGTYTGRLAVDGFTYDNIQIVVVRNSDTKVFLKSAPSNAGYTSSFEANVWLQKEGMILNVPVQAVGTDAIYGNHNTYPANTAYHGAYVLDSEQLSYAILLRINGVEHTESFQGYKK